MLITAKSFNQAGLGDLLMMEWEYFGQRTVPADCSLPNYSERPTGREVGEEVTVRTVPSAFDGYAA
jgi:hypothetical protein